MTQFPPPQPGPGGPPPQPPQPGWGAPQAPQAPGPQPWQQQQQPQPGHPPQGYGQQPPKGNSNAALWVILVLLLVGGGVGAFLMLGKDEGGSTSSPEGAARGYAEAGIDGDCERATEFATEEFAAGDCTTDPVPNASVASVETVQEEGDGAVVEVTVEAAGQEQVVPLQVSRIDGDWRVSGQGDSLPASSGGGNGSASSGSSDGGDGGDGGDGDSGDSGDGGGTSSGAGGSPEDVVATYAAAVISGNCDAALAVAESSVVDADCDEGVSLNVTVLDIETRSESDTAATVTVTLEVDGEEVTGDYHLANNGDGWVIAQFSN